MYTDKVVHIYHINPTLHEELGDSIVTLGSQIKKSGS